MTPLRCDQGFVRMPDAEFEAMKELEADITLRFRAFG